MTEENKSIELCQDILATRLAQMIAEREKITPTEAIRKLMATQTYALLLGAEYIPDIYYAEQRGDWEHWTEV